MAKKFVIAKKFVLAKKFVMAKKFVLAQKFVMAKFIMTIRTPNLFDICPQSTNPLFIKNKDSWLSWVPTRAIALTQQPITKRKLMGQLELLPT